MKKISKKAQKEIINKLYQQYFDRVQVSMMKLPQIYSAIEGIQQSEHSEDIKNEMYLLLVETYKVGA